MRFERDPESGLLVPQREIIAPRRRFAMPIFRRYGATMQAMLAQKIAGGGAPASPPYSDDFTRANENPIAGDWESGLGANGQVQISGNAAVVVSGKGVASVKASALNINSDQKVEIVINADALNVGARPTARCQSNGAYYSVWCHNGFSLGNISKTDASGTETEIGSRIVLGWLATETMGIEIIGTTITFYKISSGIRYNLKSETDSTLSGGQPGFVVESGSTITDFLADNA